MAEGQRGSVGGVSVETASMVDAMKTPNTDPENGQLLQPDTDLTASAIIFQGDQYLDKILSKIRR